jgi:hypothetical protein
LPGLEKLNENGSLGRDAAKSNPHGYLEVPKKKKGRVTVLLPSEAVSGDTLKSQHEAEKSREEIEKSNSDYEIYALKRSEIASEKDKVDRKEGSSSEGDMFNDISRGPSISKLGLFGKKLGSFLKRSI